MPVVHVVVESTFTGQGSGFQHLAIDDKFQVNDLIQQYCLAKGIPVNPEYTLVNHTNLVLKGTKPLSYYGVKNNEAFVLGTAVEESMGYRYGHWFTMAALAFFLGLLGITACVIFYAVIRTIPENYAIVVDAGSTHSDVILYKWPGAKVNNTGEVVQVSTCYIKEGITDMKNVPSYFDPCFTSSQGKIPPASQPTVEVLLGATAGMRLLNDSSKASAIIASIKQYLTTRKLTFKDSNVGIIDGSIEGISGWITLNFLKDTIYSEIGYLNSSWGALDLGGASTQITLEVSKEYESHPLVSTLQLFGHKFLVYSQSFLCFGVVQSYLRYRALLLKEHLASNDARNLTISSPCEPIGKTVNTSFDDFQVPCLKSMHEFDKLAGAVANYTFVGTGDSKKCEGYVKSILNRSNCLSIGWDNCIDSSSIPSFVSDRKFMAFASYTYVTNALLIKKKTTTQDYLKKTNELCALTYVKVLEMKSNDSGNNYRDLENTCFKAHYVFAFLNEAYGFTTDEKWDNIEFTSKINNASVGWSLGYMINATEKIATGKSIPSLSTVPFALLLVLFITFLIISFGFVYHGVKLRKSSPANNSYQRKVAIQMDEELVKFIMPQTADW